MSAGSTKMELARRPLGSTGAPPLKDLGSVAAVAAIATENYCLELQRPLSRTGQFVIVIH